MTITLTIILAITLDHLLGEPTRYHPLVGFGRLVNRVESFLRQPDDSERRQRWLGFFGWLLLTLPLPVALLWMPQSIIVDSFLLYWCIAPTSLKQHAERVYHALLKSDLAGARAAVAAIVSRETAYMQARQIQKSAVESVLENGADAVFAPIFWFVIAGSPGVVFYRLTNTLDAMWGYKNQSYYYFGRTAARMDDALNWLPARLTAVSYALSGNTRQALRCWHTQAPQLDSPNAGPVMTAGAGALNVQLGGAAVYHGRVKAKIAFGGSRVCQREDITRASRLMMHCLGLWVACIAVGEAFA